MKGLGATIHYTQYTVTVLLLYTEVCEVLKISTSQFLKWQIEFAIEPVDSNPR